jgi:glycosyltransferase involved in cell wall biosynthesis
MNKDRLRILFVNNTSRVSAGTTRSLLLNLKHLQGKYSLGVAAPPDSESLPSILLGQEIPFYRLGVLPLASLRRLVLAIRDANYAVVYANSFSKEGCDAFFAAKLTGRAFIWHIRDPVRRAWFRRVIRYSDAVIANSQDTADEIGLRAGYAMSTVIPNGIAREEFELDRATARASLLDELQWPSDAFVMANLGFLCSRKNQLDAVEITRQVVAKHPEARLVCVGAPADIGYPEKLWARIREGGIHGKVRLIGVKGNPATYLLAADLLLHTSVCEPQGRVVLEAMAAKLPVVAYNVGGIPEAVVEGETGFLVPAGATTAASAAICRLIAEPDLRHGMGAAGYSRVIQHFTDEDTASRVDRVIMSVLEKRRRT